jgi:outer membrane protein TolC
MADRGVARGLAARVGATFAVVALLAAAPAAPAAGAPVAAPEAAAPLTLEDCLVRALLDGPRVQAARGRVELAAARVSEARWAAFPKATFVGLFSYAPGTGGDPQTREGDLFDTWGPVVRLDLKGEAPLYTFGRMGAETDAARHRHEAARAGVAEASSDVAWRVRRAWYFRRAARERLRVIDAALTELGRIEARLSELEEEDDPSLDPTDPVRLRVRRSDLDIRRSEAARAEADATARLRVELGVPAGAPLALADVPLEPVTAAAGPLEEYTAVARSLNPAVRGLLAEVLAAREVVRARERAFFPEVFVAGGARYGYAGAYAPQPSPFAADEENSWSAWIAVGLRVPLDWPALVLRRDEAEAVLARSAWQRRVGSDRAEVEVARAHGELVDLLALLPGRRDAARAAREWLTARLEGYEQGRVKLSAAMSALEQHVDRQAAAIDAVRDLNVAVAALSRAAGVDAAVVAGERLTPAQAGEVVLPPGFELPSDLSPALRERVLRHLREREKGRRQE